MRGRHQPRGFVVALALVGVAACGGPPAETPDAAARGDVGSDFCTGDDECDDTIFCNGRELCRPGALGADARGCLDARGPACAASQRCDERLDRCETNCDVAPDADGDGVAATACGGTDCDDADPRRFPGNAEVCDGMQHDEDCDAATFGARDDDGDGSPAATCCNVASGGALRCGTDCNDHDRTIGPGAAEYCDRRDQDCDGATDEGVTRPAFEDADRDLHGNPMVPVMGCPGLPGVVLTNDDCDDTRGAVYVGAPEICDARDNDCDARVDEDALPVTWYRDLDGDGFGNATSGTTVSCAPPAGYSLFSTDCDDHRRTTSPLSREACNGIDDDCTGFADFPVGPGDLEDDDRDGYADPRCGVTATDCDDLDPFVHPGAPELCNLRDDDCDGAIETGEMTIAWYPDRDGDGAGAEGSVPIYSCDVVEGRVPVRGDCDDRSAAIGPLALDACGTGVDGADDDCDGSVDEAGGESAFYIDADGDGFGAGAPVLVCTAPAALRARGGDCLDTDARVHPGLVESCAVLDGVDDDCDGLVDCLDPDCAGEAACGPPVSLAVVSGDGQGAYPGFPLPAPVVVLATSSTGAPVPGAMVHFSASPGALVTDALAIADAEGLARTYVRVGLALGDYSITATANGATPRVLVATALAAPDGIWLPMIDARRLGSPGSGPTGLLDGAASIAARPHVMPSVDAMRFVSIGTVHGLVVPLPGDHCVVSIDAGGLIHVVAGQCGVSGRDDGDEGGPARAALLSGPTAVALDAAGHRLFVADAGNERVRAIALDDGTISTVAGGGLEEPPALDGTLPAPALRLGATHLAYDPTSDELWLDHGAACVRSALATFAATTVSLCPPAFPHPGLSTSGTTLLGASPIGPSDASAPLPLLPAVDTAPFGYVGLAAFGVPSDVRLPITATLGGHVVGAIGRTSDTASYLSVGTALGTFVADVWTHPELGTSHLTIRVSASPGDVFTASSDTAGLSWLATPTAAAITLRDGVATTTSDGLFVLASPSGFEVLSRIDPVSGYFPTFFSATSDTYGRLASTVIGGSRYEQVDLRGVVVRTETIVSGTTPLAVTALDGSIYFIASSVDASSGAAVRAVERRVVGSAPQLLTDVDTVLSLTAIHAMAVDATGALWIIGANSSDGTPLLFRRNLDGTHDVVPLPPAAASLTGYNTGLARAPDGSMVVLASSVYRIDPATLAITQVPTGGVTFDDANALVVDAQGHLWIQHGSVTSVVW